jgi:hypothetical protein
MTSKKARQRAQPTAQIIQPSQPQFPQSDYESDVLNLVVQPPSSTRTPDELNLAVLRSHFPDIEAILSIAPYVVVYCWQNETSQWEKSGVEGSLFVCRLAPDQQAEPFGSMRFSVVVLNRRGLDNFLAPLESSEDVEITEEYVILNAADNVYGLWIYAEENMSTAQARTINASLIKECATSAERSRTEVQNGKTLLRETAVVHPPSGHFQAKQSLSDEGRTISMAELFGQSQSISATQNDRKTPPAIQISESPASSARASPLPPPIPSTTKPNEGMFPVSEDTMFFRRGPTQRKSPKPQENEPVQAAETHQDILANLFRNAHRG